MRKIKSKFSKFEFFKVFIIVELREDSDCSTI